MISLLKRSILAALCILGAGALHAQNPIDDAQLYGTANQVTSGAILTVQSGATLAVASGGTITLPDNALAIADTSGLQTALDAKQPLDATLTGLAATSFTVSGQVPYATGTDTFATITSTTFGRSLWDDADAATARNTLGASAGVFPANLVASAGTGAAGVVPGLGGSTSTNAATIAQVMAGDTINTASRAGLPGLIANGSAIPLYIPDSPVHAYGLDDLGFTLRLTLADYTPSANVVLLDKVASNLGVRVTLLTTGIIRVQIGNGTDLTTYQYDSTAAVSAVVTDGQPLWLDLDLDRDGNLTVWAQGAALGNAVSISAASAQTLTSTGTLKLLSNGSTHYAGVIHAFYARNVVLTAAERTVLFLAGPSALPVYAVGGQQMVRNAPQNADFTAATTNWTAAFGLTSATIDGANSELDLLSSGASGIALIGGQYFGNESTIYIGTRWRVRLTLRNYSGLTSISGIFDGGPESFTASPSPVNANGDYTFTRTVTTTSNGSQTFRAFGLICTGTGSVSVANVVVTRFGFLGIYELVGDSLGLAVMDRTPNRLDAVRTSPRSTSYSNNGRRAVVRATLVNASGSSANIQLLGQDAVDTSRNWRIASVSGNSSASINLSLGATSGSATYVNTQAVNGNFDISTFASRLPGASAALWAILSANATVQVTVVLEAID